jgi:hypothetical protein
MRCIIKTSSLHWQRTERVRGDRMLYTLQQIADDWHDQKIIPVKEVAHDLEMSERWVVREAQRRHVEIVVLLTKAPHLTKRGARYLRWVPADFALELAKETNANAPGNVSKLSKPELRCDLRNVLNLASEESAPITTAIQMGLLSVLERLGRRAHELNDPELEEVLHILGL